jgi:hypothetical protein
VVSLLCSMLYHRETDIRTDQYGAYLCRQHVNHNNAYTYDNFFDVHHKAADRSEIAFDNRRKHRIRCFRFRRRHNPVFGFIPPGHLRQERRKRIRCEQRLHRNRSNSVRRGRLRPFSTQRHRSAHSQCPLHVLGRPLFPERPDAGHLLSVRRDGTQSIPHFRVVRHQILTKRYLFRTLSS